jgi:CRISPR-associated protein Cas2
MPATSRTRYLIAYDVSADSNRSKLSKFLEDFGDRVQKSVFEADLTDEELRLIVKFAKPLVEQDDSLRFYALCANCRKKIQGLGAEVSCASRSLYIV